jgi:phage shock protein A
MFEGLKRRFKYYNARSQQRFEAKADPTVQLEQAIAEAHDQHRRLKEQAASLIAQQKQTELQLNRKMGELEKVNGNARQALMMADEANRAGDQARMLEYTNAAEAFAGRLVSVEREIDDLKALHFQASQAADQAKAAVAQNATALQAKLVERQKLLGQLDQARMQEQINQAMTSLQETVGQDVPTFDEVRTKIEARYAKAKGVAELGDSAVEGRMMEIEQASMHAEAQGRLDEIRQQLGLPAADTASGALGTGAAAGAGTGAGAAQSGELNAGTPADAAPQAEPTQQVPSDPA